MVLLLIFVEDKVIKTENTKKTYKECRKKIENYKLEQRKFDDMKNRLDAYRKEFEEYKKEYKYKHKFFNFI